MNSEFCFRLKFSKLAAASLQNGNRRYDIFFASLKRIKFLRFQSQYIFFVDFQYYKIHIKEFRWFLLKNVALIFVNLAIFLNKTGGLKSKSRFSSIIFDLVWPFFCYKKDSRGCTAEKLPKIVPVLIERLFLSNILKSTSFCFSSGRFTICFDTFL